jgi:polyphosphate kinase 2 (PPK2 family)
VREVENENKSMQQRLAAAEAQRFKHEEAAALQNLALQRLYDELSDLKDRLAESRDAAAIEVATANARHSKELLEQQRAAVESSRSYKVLLQQRDAKISELHRLLSVLSPKKVRVAPLQYFF